MFPSYFFYRSQNLKMDHKAHQLFTEQNDMCDVIIPFHISCLAWEVIIFLTGLARFAFLKIFFSQQWAATDSFPELQIRAGLFGQRCANKNENWWNPGWITTRAQYLQASHSQIICVYQKKIVEHMFVGTWVHVTKKYVFIYVQQNFFVLRRKFLEKMKVVLPTQNGDRQAKQQKSIGVRGPGHSPHSTLDQTWGLRRP